MELYIVSNFSDSHSMRTVYCICVWKVMMLAGGLRSALLELPSVTVWDLGESRKPVISADDQTHHHGQCGLVTFSVRRRSSSWSFPGFSRTFHVRVHVCVCVCVCVCRWTVLIQ